MGRFYNNEIAECTASQVARSDSREFVAGTFVWSGFDYFGESRGYPQTVKCRGVVADIAGFLKESYHLRVISRNIQTEPMRTRGTTSAKTTARYAVWPAGLHQMRAMSKIINIISSSLIDI
eukprot:COSAG01_NODE_1095_length_11714_cov_9.062930_4_plen_121_part_00